MDGQMNQSGGAPLNGVRILDLTQYLAGPYCTMVLADLGADVVKVERPGTGDDGRRVGTAFVGNLGVLFATLNRNKHSIELDLKSDDGRSRFLELVDRADMVVENFRPQTMQRLGLGYEALKARNSALIYVSIAGYGQDGPLSKLGGFNLVLQAESGIMSITGSEGGDPASVPLDLLDTSTGTYAAIGALAALSQRSQTGVGQKVETSLLDTAIGWMIGHVGVYDRTGLLPQRLGTADRNTVPTQAFRTSDGWLVISTGSSESLWVRLCEAIKAPELSSDSRFQANKNRVENRQALVATMESALAHQTTAEWVDVIRAAGVPCAPVNGVAEALSHPQVRHNGILVEHEVMGEAFRMPALPIRLDGARPMVRRPAPELGEDNARILERWSAR